MPGMQLLGGETIGSDALPIARAGPHPMQPEATWGPDLTAPFPTNRFWQNFVLRDGDVVGGDVVSPLPYLVQASEQGLAVSYPLSSEWAVSKEFIVVPFYSKVILGASDLPSTHHVAAYDELSTTLQWVDGEKKMRVPVVRGMPYVSAFYSGLMAQVLFPAASITSVEGKHPPVSLHGRRFSVALGNGQTWHVYAHTDVDIRVEPGAVNLASPFRGVLRVALVPDGMEDLLDQHSGAVPIGGDVSATSEDQDATMTFKWKVEGSGDLLAMALPHHLDVLAGATFAKHSGTGFRTLKGTMHAVIGATWEMHEPLLPLLWTAPRPIASDKVDALRVALRMDMDKPLEATDPYGGGKELGALGRLVLIAEELGESEIAGKIRKRLAGALEAWLSTESRPDNLLYEPTYGGVVSSNSLVNSMADFGNAYYNDHHFCYGYFLYAAAVVGKGDPAWLKKWGDAVLHLYRDIANPTAKDSLYTVHRHKDFFVGHSWASGLFPSVSGRNQESSSECVNAYYGAALLGEALGDMRLRDFGRLLMATEIRATWHYWQIDTTDIYPQPFADNKLVTNIWSTKVDALTWFGSNVEYRFGIQIIPVTPITEYLLRLDWIKVARAEWKDALVTCEQQWRAFLLAADALVDDDTADAAWKASQHLFLFDDGNSKTNMLHFLATRGPALPVPPHLPSRPSMFSHPPLPSCPPPISNSPGHHASPGPPAAPSLSLIASGSPVAAYAPPMSKPPGYHASPSAASTAPPTDELYQRRHHFLPLILVLSFLTGCVCLRRQYLDEEARRFASGYYRGLPGDTNTR